MDLFLVDFIEENVCVVLVSQVFPPCLVIGSCVLLIPYSLVHINIRINHRAVRHNHTDIVHLSSVLGCLRSIEIRNMQGEGTLEFSFTIPQLIASESHEFFRDHGMIDLQHRQEINTQIHMLLIE